MRLVWQLGMALAATLTLGSGVARATCPNPIVAPFNLVTSSPQTVKGLKVIQYLWYDSQCLQRTVAIKLEGQGNPGHGGYAVQMTYQTAANTVTIDKETGGDGGFGYFVSHERYRTFVDGASDTIASKIFGRDDSPLGLIYPVTGASLSGSPDTGAYRFATSYYHYGTVDPDPVDASGNDTTPLPLEASAYALYRLPIVITWVFQAQTDAPRYDVAVNLSNVGVADRVSFDLRAPYGVMVFDNNLDGLVTRVQWGDRYQFVTGSSPVTRNSSWTWKGGNFGGRYNAMIAGAYEMGIYEPVKFGQSRTRDGYADERSSTSALYNGGMGCAGGETQILPCDWEWPYQGLQYSLPYDSNTTPTNFKKIAWGTTAFYGAGPGLTRVFDTSFSSEPFVGFPASKLIKYSVCILVGRTVSGGLTHAAALAPNCASAIF